DAGMVGAGQPERLIAQHAGATGEDVLDGVVEHVAKGEDAGDVGRRDDDGIGRFGRPGVSDEAFALEPELIPLRLDGSRVVCFGYFRHNDLTTYRESLFL